MKTDWGMVVCRDDTPTKGTLEIKLSIPEMNEFLGLPEIRNDLNLAFKEMRELKALGRLQLSVSVQTNKVSGAKVDAMRSDLNRVIKSLDKFVEKVSDPLARLDSLAEDQTSKAENWT